MSSKKEYTELQVFKTVMYYSMVIIILPLISFFTSKVFLFDGLLGFQEVPSNVSAAGVSILVVHVALGLFIYRAYFDERSKIPTKRD